MFKNRTLLNIVLIGLMVQLIVVLMHFYVVPHPNSGADAVRMERRAWEMTDTFTATDLITVANYNGSRFYMFFVAILYLIFGRAEVIPILANIVFGSLLVFAVYGITSHLTSNKNAWYTSAVLAAVFPTLLLYSTVIQREAPLILLFAISLYAFVRWMKEDKEWLIVIAMATICLSGLLHFGVMIVALIYALFFGLYDPKIHRWVPVNTKKLLSRTILRMGVLAAFVAVAMYILTPRLIAVDMIEYLEWHLEHAVAGEAAYLDNMIPESHTDIVFQTPVRVAYFLYAPFPWEVEDRKDLFAAGASLVFMILTLLSILGFIQIWKKDRNIAIAILLMLTAVIVMYAWGTSNYGTAMRHKNKIVWILIILSSVGLHTLTWFRARAGRSITDDNRGAVCTKDRTMSSPPEDRKQFSSSLPSDY